MSAPAAIVAIQFVGAALATKSAIEGIKEGNLLKAAIGGVGAYYGFSSLATTAAGGAAGAATQGTGLEKAVVEQGAKTTIGGEGATALSTTGTEVAADSLAQSAVEQGAGMDFAGVSADAASSAANPELAMAGRQMARTSAGITPVAPETGFMTDLKNGWNQFKTDWIGTGEGASVAGDGSSMLGETPYERGMTRMGLMQMAGSYMQGEAMEDKAKWEQEQRERVYNEQRQRRGYTAASPFGNTVWNPQTGRFEVTA